jgi:hypothetical protein
LPYFKRPQQQKEGSDPPAASPTAPLKPEDLHAFGTDHFSASAALRAGVSGPRTSNLSAEAGQARMRELHEELARAKATVLEVRPKMAIIKRSIRFNEGKMPESALFQNVPLQEKFFTQQVAAHIAAEPEALRKAAIAIGQYEAAWEALRLVEEALTEAEMGLVEDAVERLAGVSVEKMRGQVFPLTSLSVHFEADPVLSRLFMPPHMTRPKGTGRLDPNDVPPYKNSPQPYTLGDLFRPTVKKLTDIFKNPDEKR